MGNLADLDPDDVGTDIFGSGKSLVTWWDTIADDEDRATFREWVDEGTSARVLADRLTRSGHRISQHTVMFGLHLLRRHRWAT